MSAVIIYKFLYNYFRTFKFIKKMHAYILKIKLLYVNNSLKIFLIFKKHKFFNRNFLDVNNIKYFRNFSKKINFLRRINKLNFNFGKKFKYKRRYIAKKIQKEKLSVLIMNTKNIKNKKEKFFSFLKGLKKKKYYFLLAKKRLKVTETYKHTVLERYKRRFYRTLYFEYAKFLYSIDNSDYWLNETLYAKGQKENWKTFRTTHQVFIDRKTDEARLLKWKERHLKRIYKFKFSKLLYFKFFSNVLRIKKKFLKIFKRIFNNNIIVNLMIFIRRNVRNSFTADSLSDSMIYRLKQKRNIRGIMKSVLSLLNRRVKQKKIKGYSILLTGRFTRKDRAVYEWYNKGKFKRNDRTEIIDYANRRVALKYSSVSFKISLFKGATRSI